MDHNDPCPDDDHHDDHDDDDDKDGDDDDSNHHDEQCSLNMVAVMIRIEICYAISLILAIICALKHSRFEVSLYHPISHL